jgi:hypothetical protein
MQLTPSTPITVPRFRKNSFIVSLFSRKNSGRDMDSSVNNSPAAGAYLGGALLSATRSVLSGAWHDFYE